MSIPLRARPALLTLVLLGGLALFAANAQAGDPRTGRIDLAARLEPADLAAGQSGLLVVDATLLPKLHIAATGETAMTYEPVETSGVAYHLDTVELSPHHVWKDEMGDELDVWEETFVFKVKVTLSDDVGPGAKVGMRFTYFGCNEEGCYPPVKRHEASAVLTAGSPAGGPAPAPPGVAADAGPTVSAVPLYDEGGARLEIDEEKSEAVVTFEPGFGWHFYGPQDTTGSTQVEVLPKKAEGVTWGKPDYPPAGEIHERYAVRIPFTREKEASRIAIEVRWGGCQGDAMTGTCNPPRKETLKAVWSQAGQAPVVPVPAPTATPQPPVEGELLFPVVDDDNLAAPVSKIARLVKENLFLALLLIFAGGMALAFTPCVLPIIPITVSIITGGNADIPKPRLAALLGTYVAGMALAFATMGVIAALAGGSMSTAFTLPAVQWGIAILFLVLSFGMLGIYELQPPAWMMKLQGGAQKRSGSFLGAFLFGCLGAVIASPCTGPAIAGLLIATAESGSAVLGFFLFLTLGLGMGAVFFAAGSLNFALRPGPWMVWVRYVFGALLIGAALYYLAAGGLIDQKQLFIGGFLLAMLAWVGIAWHLTKREGEEAGPARVRGAKVAVMLIVVTGLIGILTRRPDNLLDWTYAKDTEHLVQLVEDARANGKPVVVDFWAEWCFYCKEYDALIAENPDLRSKFERVVRIKVDLTDDAERWDMRHAVGVMEALQPFLVFLDRQGRIRRRADVPRWFGADGPKELNARLDLVLASKKKASLR